MASHIFYQTKKLIELWFLEMELWQNHQMFYSLKDTMKMVFVKVKELSMIQREIFFLKDLMIEE